MIATCSGVYVYSDDKDEFERIFEEKSLLTSRDAIVLEEDIYNNIWIGTENGLNKVDIKTKKIHKYFEEEKNGISKNMKI